MCRGLPIAPETPLTMLLLRVRRLGSAIPQVQVPAALEDDVDNCLVEGACAYFVEQFGGILTVSARDMK